MGLQRRSSRVVRSPVGEDDDRARRSVASTLGGTERLPPDVLKDVGGVRAAGALLADGGDGGEDVGAGGVLVDGELFVRRVADGHETDADRRRGDVREGLDDGADEVELTVEVRSPDAV